MNVVKILVLSLAVVMVSASAYYAVDNTQKNQNFNAKVMPTSGVLTDALALNPVSCSMTAKAVQDAVGHDFKMPKELPPGYSIQDGWTSNGILSLYYAPGPICGPNAQYTTFESGILQYYTALDKSAKAAEIQQGQKYFDESKAKSQRGNLISFFEINGMAAMGWEKGMRNSIAMWDNGTIIDKHPIPYPAEIQMIDTSAKTFYMLKGNFPLTELKTIAKSIG